MLKEILLGIFTNQADRKISLAWENFNKEKEETAFLNACDEFEIEFEKVHDGTIITCDIFFARLKAEKIIQHIFDYYLNTTQRSRIESEFLSCANDTLIKSIEQSGNQHLSIPDKEIIRDFIDKISARISAYLFQKSPDSDRPLYYSLDQVRLETKQQQIATRESIAEHSAHIDENFEVIRQAISSSNSDILHKIDTLTANVASISQMNPVLGNMVIDSSAELLIVGLQEYEVQIASIESLQKEHRFIEAIDKYKEIREDILYKATEKAIKISDDVLHIIDINSALCYGNLRQFAKAGALLDRIKRSGGYENKKYHYVAAAIILMQNEISTFPTGLSHLTKALEIDAEYYKAILLKSIFQAILGLGTFESISKVLDDTLVKTKIIDKDDDLKAEYYSKLGMLSLHFNMYNDAVQNYLLSNSVQTDIINQINIAITYYRWAFQGNTSAERVLKPSVDYLMLDKAASLMNELFVDNSIKNSPVLREILPVYISICHFLHKFDEVVKISKKFDLSEIDDETQRNIAISKIVLEIETDEDVAKLDEQDALAHKVSQLMSVGDCKSAIALLESAEKATPALLCDKTYTQLAECYLKSESTEDYRSLKDRLAQQNLSLTYINLLDAKYYELIGDVDKVNTLCSNFAAQSTDESELNYTVYFFRVNQKNDFLCQLYERIVGLLQRNEMPRLFHPEAFLKHMFNDLVRIDFRFVCDIYKKISPDLFGDEIHRQIGIKLAIIQFDSYTAIHLLEDSIRKNASLSDYMYLIHCLKNCCRFENALSTAKVVEERYFPNNVDETTDFYELQSELYLFVNDSDNSYKYIKKARDLHIKDPYHAIHQFYMSRATRCNHVEDGLRDSIEFKHLHPNITDWLQEIEAFREAPDGTMQQTDQLRNILEDHGNRFTTLIGHYKGKKISLLQLSVSLSTHVASIIDYSKTFKFRLRVFSGNDESLTQEMSVLIVSKVVAIDDLSLSFLAYYDALRLLDSFEQVHITSSSIIRIQTDYIETGAQYLYTALQYIGQNQNIVVDPNLFHAYNLFREDSEEANLYPQSVHDTLNVSKAYSIPYIYCDESLGIFLHSQEITGISIVALISFYKKTDLSFSNALAYKLLSDNVEFINFNADDMFFAIANSNCPTFRDSVKPFFKVSSASDVMSFAHVYYNLLVKLRECRPDMFENAVRVILEYADACYRRSSYHLDSSLQYSSAKDYFIVKQLMTFSMSTLALIKRIIGLDNFKRIVSSGVIKYIPSSMIGKITDSPS